MHISEMTTNLLHLVEMQLLVAKRALANVRIS